MSWPKSEDPLPFRSFSAIPGSSSEEDGKPGPRAFVFSLQHRPRATRASVPKVRSGCITCKRRHVKCDEAKPACQRCMKWQGACEGYSISDSKRDRSKSPASLADSDGSPTPPRYTRSPCREKLQTPVPDQEDAIDSQREEMYSNHWSALAVNLGGGLFPSTVFTEIIPQLARTDPAVRCAVIAVAALANAVAPNTIPDTAAKAMETCSHYNSAINYYGRALRLVRLQQDLGSDQTLRAIMICCILFACFEALHNSPDAAIKHINYGLVILEHFVCTAESIAAGEPIRREGSPASFTLDEEIFQVFRRLECLSWSSRLSRQQPTIPRIHRCPLRFNVEDAFVDILVARKQLDLAQHQTMRTVLAENMKRSPGSVDMNENIDPELLDQIEFYDLDVLEKWRFFFEPLYASTEAAKATSPEQYLQATSLLLQNVSTWLTLRTSNMDDHHKLQSLTPHFKEIVNLCEILLEGQPKATGTTEVFTMYHGPTLALSLVLSKCVNPVVRADAITLLGKHPRRDGFWDSRAMVSTAEVKP